MLHLLQLFLDWESCLVIFWYRYYHWTGTQMMSTVRSQMQPPTNCLNQHVKICLIYPNSEDPMISGLMSD